MKRMLYALCVVLSTTAVSAANLDDFDGAKLDNNWSYRDPAKNGDYELSGGKLILDLKAGADMFRQGIDGGVMFLMDPPDQDNFSVELLENVATNNDSQAPACHVGIVFFNEDDWAYSAWGPYNAGLDIRLEDCIGADYRWRAEAQIAIDPGDVATDEDVYLRVVKTGDELAFFAKGSANEDWVSGGVDDKLGPQFTKGNYQIGIIAKSWAGSIPSTFEFEYFNVPELTLSVDAGGTLSTTWGIIKAPR